MLDVSEVVSDPEFLQTISIQRRQEGGEYQDGIFKVSREFDVLISIDASIQNDSASGSSRSQRLQNSRDFSRVKASVAICSASEIRSAKSHEHADIIKNLRGADWRVTELNDWGENGYYSGIAVRIEEGEVDV